MGTILASKIIADASILLQDPNNVRWPLSELLEWLNKGQREVVVVDPTACVRNESVKLAAGTKQALPEGGLILFDINRNMGTDGATPGRVPRYIEKSLIDAQNPNWHTDAASATVMHFIYDVRDKTRFYVYPKQPATSQGYVELMYSAMPDDIASEDDPITLDDVFANALMHYLLYMAYAKDVQTMNKADERYKTFLALVAGKTGPEEKTKVSTKAES